jgi:hypothetical protein
MPGFMSGFGETIAQGVERRQDRIDVRMERRRDYIDRVAKPAYLKRKEIADGLMNTASYLKQMGLTDDQIKYAAGAGPDELNKLRTTVDTIALRKGKSTTSAEDLAGIIQVGQDYKPDDMSLSDYIAKVTGMNTPEGLSARPVTKMSFFEAALGIDKGQQDNRFENEPAFEGVTNRQVGDIAVQGGYKPQYTGAGMINYKNIPLAPFSGPDLTAANTTIVQNMERMGFDKVKKLGEDGDKAGAAQLAYEIKNKTSKFFDEFASLAMADMAFNQNDTRYLYIKHGGTINVRAVELYNDMMKERAKAANVDGTSTDTDAGLGTSTETSTLEPSATTNTGDVTAEETKVYTIEDVGNASNISEASLDEVKNAIIFSTEAEVRAAINAGDVKDGDSVFIGETNRIEIIHFDKEIKSLDPASVIGLGGSDALVKMVSKAIEDEKAWEDRTWPQFKEWLFNKFDLEQPATTRGEIMTRPDAASVGNQPDVTGLLRDLKKWWDSGNKRGGFGE